ncbi:MAG: hypothetical protein IJM17_09095 [Firmicutes bacterium]|nr:hypothetical protein [Bacillota bacterium]
MPSLTSLQKTTRLKNEYEALKRVPFNSQYSWVPADDPPDGIHRVYLVTYKDTAPVAEYSTPLFSGDKRVKGIKNQESITLRFTLGPDYPNMMPAAEISSGRRPFLPNVFSSGAICFGGLYRPSLFLWQWFNIVGQLLLGNPEYTGYSGNKQGELPANSEADEYYRSHMSQFPVRKADFPTPPEY